MPFHLCLLVSEAVDHVGELVILVGFEDCVAEHFLLLVRHDPEGLELLTHRKYRAMPDEEGDPLSDEPEALAYLIAKELPSYDPWAKANLAETPKFAEPDGGAEAFMRRALTACTSGECDSTAEALRRVREKAKTLEVKLFLEDLQRRRDLARCPMLLSGASSH